MPLRDMISSSVYPLLLVSTGLSGLSVVRDFFPDTRKALGQIIKGNDVGTVFPDCTLDSLSVGHNFDLCRFPILSLSRTLRSFFKYGLHTCFESLCACKMSDKLLIIE